PSALLGRAPRDRLQRRVPAGRRRRHRRRRGSARAHQPSAPGSPPGRRRGGVPLPPHADPPERLTVGDGVPAWAARRLWIADLRPWRRLELELPPGLGVLMGPNGAGKTTIVEAIVLACLGVSPRTSREAEAVRRGAEAFRVALALAGPEGEQRREIGYAPGRGRRLAVDGQPARSLGAWRGRRAVLGFLPDELRAGKGPPAARRPHPAPPPDAAWPGSAAAP